jgi:FAD/FMN-containing dehydrogenase
MAAGVLVNDLHSQLNPTLVARVERPLSLAELLSAVDLARLQGQSVSIAGGRHAMGGQQFGEASVLIDMRGLNRVLAFDREAGVLTVEAGIQWPEIAEYLDEANAGQSRQWGIVQKQTGADRLSIGGALACNGHGRGLALTPIIGQVRAFDLVTANGEIRTCSRSTNSDLFSLVIGGYGLFGVVSRVELQLQRRVKVRRVVEVNDVSTIIDRFEDRIRDGFMYGDWQYATNSGPSTRNGADQFLRRGVFSCYQPVPDSTPVTAQPVKFTNEDWAALVCLAHTDKERAFEIYADRYLKTTGQVYWADSQLAPAYVDHYHTHVDAATKATVPGSEMITEIYVPRAALASFMADARHELRRRDANVIYGTVRMIEPDRESFLAWAKERFACVIFNLHVDHTPAAIAKVADTFRSLIDLGIKYRGSYYLTYHRWARKDQVEACYPQMRAFLALKKMHDPDELFQSTWYRHYRHMFHDAYRTASAMSPASRPEPVAMTMNCRPDFAR